MDRRLGSETLDESPILAREHRLVGSGRLRLKGRGDARLVLDGSGRVTAHRGAQDDFRFDGQGLPRHLNGTCVLLANARGSLRLSGEAIDVEFSAGRVEVLVNGEFDLEVDGQGEIHTARGERAPWGRQVHWRVEGPRFVRL